MKIFGFILKRLRKLWRSNESLLPGIDTHKWESKIEIFRSLSEERH
jgi:hypothetical protein